MQDIGYILTKMGKYIDMKKKRIVFQMTEKAMTVKELKEWLNGVSEDMNIKLSITYDNCEHIQNLNDVYAEGIWLYLIGKQQMVMWNE